MEVGVFVVVRAAGVVDVVYFEWAGCVAACCTLVAVALVYAGFLGGWGAF